MEEEANIKKIRKIIHMKVEVAKLATLECEINVMQDDFMKVRNDYDKTVEPKEVAIKIL